jgi:ferredoxin
MAAIRIGPSDIRVDGAKCVSGGFCVSIVPALFLLDDSYVAHVGEAALVEIDDVEEAIACCPAQAIAWIAPPVAHDSHAED